MNWKREFPTQMARNEAITSFATRVYSWLGIGLLTTAAVAFAVQQFGLDKTLAPFGLLLGLGLMGIAYTMQRRAQSLSFEAMAALFTAYAVIEGLFFGTIIPLYIAASGIQTVWLAFAAAAVTSVTAITYGALTKADLTAVRSLFNIGLLAILATTLLSFALSFFMPVQRLQLMIAYVGVVLFVGLAAADAQQIQEVSRRLEFDNRESVSKLSLLVALRMYANVVMIFLYMLQIFGSSRDER